MKFSILIITMLARVHYWIIYVFRKILVIVELALFLRALLVFLAANPQSFVVSATYKFTDLVVWPFQSIFQNIEIIGRTLDVETISAMAGYLIVYFILTRLLGLLVRS